MTRSLLATPLARFVIALVLASGVLSASVFGVGPLPPLGAALNAGNGVWTGATDARPIQSQTLRFPGLQQPVTVVFEQNGNAHVRAATDHDLFWTIGYLHARFRLTEMELERRQGEGLLSEIVGAQALGNDEFINTLGLRRTAQAEWQALPSSSPARQAELAYADGVNARIAEDERDSDLPFVFKLLNFQPRPWTPIDSLVVQGDLILTQDFNTTPLMYAEMITYLGYDRTMQWFPVLPSDTQHPYDSGPYAATGALAPLPAQLALAPGTMGAVAALEAQVRQLPSGEMRRLGDSNNWAVNGPKTATGAALMAGDPHLDLTLPSQWYQIEGSSPTYQFSGVSVPGIPVILIGRTPHISWSLTDTQNQSTLFYSEQTDKAHPHQYFWNGAWHPMQHLSYDIPVRGSDPMHQDVYLTVHGPIGPPDPLLPSATLSIAWMGALPTDDGDALLAVMRATTFTQFRAALAGWKAPTLNFVYADDQGNIGMIAPGYYPVVKAGAAWLPLPGTGEADISGSIPYDQVPQVYDPPNHVVFSANQRPVANDYPYYIGSTWNDFDNGYRANELYATLTSTQQLTVKDMEQLQNSTHDYLAGLLVPALLNSLQGATLSGTEQQALALLRGWNENMDAGSAAGAIWWTFLNRYLVDTFQPWWTADKVPGSDKAPELVINSNQASLVQDLEVWTLHDPHNAVFTPPNASARDATQVMLQAFKESVAELGKTLGNDPRGWQWGALHQRQVLSLLQVDSLNYGPRASGGDSWTVNAAGTTPMSASDPTQDYATHGPSWRMIVDWGSGRAEGVYPGGADDNPASAWYENQIALWFSGGYYPLLDSTAAQHAPGSVTWTFARG